MLVTSLAAFFFANIFSGIVAPKIKQFLKIKPHVRIKPFDCAMCLSIWVAAILYFSPVEISWFIAVVFGAGFLSSKIQ